MKKKIIVIGGGFAGLQFIKNIDKKLFDVLLLDKVNHHQFQPLFYQVATSQLEPSSISFPLRYIFNRKPGIQIRLTEVISIDAGNKRVDTPIGIFDYDILVIATGCTTNFFGNNQVSQYALTLKSTSEAIEVRNHVLQLFEQILSADEEERKYLYNLVIVGAGPTGVELAGAFAEIRKYILPKDYPGVDFSRFKIILVEGSAHTLNSMSATAQQASEKYLREMGIDLMMGLFVKDYDGKNITLSNGEVLLSKSMIWAAGVTGNKIPGLKEETAAPGNRLKVDRFNTVAGCENIYALGDIALMETPKYPKGHPQLANVAINQAKLLAKNFKRKATGKTLVEFEYRDLGSMATVGKHKAVVDLPFTSFKGYLAWFIWMFLHLMLILGVRNKLIIFINWAWNYFTKNTSLRLILNPGKK